MARDGFVFEAERSVRAGFCARVGGFFLSVSNVRVTSDVPYPSSGRQLVMSSSFIVVIRPVALLNRGRLAKPND